MNGSQAEGKDRPPALPLHDLAAERHVALLTGMTAEAARAFVFFHSGRQPQRRARTSPAARSPDRTAPSM
jgi:hypothetical protein